MKILGYILAILGLVCNIILLVISTNYDSFTGTSSFHDMSWLWLIATVSSIIGYRILDIHFKIKDHDL